MTDQAPTVSELVASFQLRRRASTHAFSAGVRLSRSGSVQLERVAAHEVLAKVIDDQQLSVTLCVERGALVGNCPCPAAAADICRHQVAVAHTVWVDDRRNHRSR